MTLPQLAANLSLMFAEQPFLDRFAAAADEGFRAVEFMFPYEWEPGTVAEMASAHGLETVLFNCPAGDWTAGERGLAALPDRVAECREGVTHALDYARALDCRKLHLMAGIVPDGADRAVMEGIFVENIRFAADLAAGDGIEILIEPINTRVDIPDYFHSSTGEAVALLDRAGRENARLQYDIYHMQIMEGDLIRRIEALLDRIGHIQIADNPGRGEPGTGEINFQTIFERLDAIGYSGHVGCEYRPMAETAAGLGWAAPFLTTAGG
jgi:hydroxypyruvate isomerase